MFDEENFHFHGNSYFRYMKILRKLLFPFALLYGGITALRNLLYNNGLLKSKEYDIPIICVGNLSTGGTGKSPMIEYLISFLKNDFKVAVLSRGYGRKTRGFREVLNSSKAIEVGDEPLQFKNKYPNITIAVCEDRQTGIEKLRKNADIILLDDAFQHRKVKASLNILLTPFHDLFVNDFILPMGNLREPKSGADRADIIVVTKCPPSIETSKREEIRVRLQRRPEQEVYFTKIGYGEEIKNNTERLPLEFLNGKEFLLVTGIANPTPLVSFLKEKSFSFTHKSFTDHHNFSFSEIAEFEKNKLVLTTEKDYMRLQNILKKATLYYLPINTVFITKEEYFRETIKKAAAFYF